VSPSRMSRTASAAETTLPLSTFDKKDGLGCMVIGDLVLLVLERHIARGRGSFRGDQ
jgi:hypothetical protein